MNHIYKTVWNSKLGTWTAVQETAKSHGKSSRAGSGASAGVASNVRFAFTLVASALLLAGGQAFGQAVVVDGTAGGSATSGYMCFYRESTPAATGIGTSPVHSVICGDATTSVTNTTNGNSPKSVVMGKGATSDGETNVAIGVNSVTKMAGAIAIGGAAKALDNQAIAIGLQAEATSDFDVSIGRQAGSGTVTPSSEGRNIAIGDGALRNAVTPNNNIAMGTDAASGITGNFNIALGAYANSVSNSPGAVTANNTIAIGERARASSTNAIAQGNRTTASGGAAIAVGANANATGGYAIAQGYATQATGISSIAIGGAQNVPNQTRATATYATAIGFGANAGASGAIAIGRHANHDIKSTAPTSAGRSKTTGADSIAIGTDTHAGGESALAIGKGAQATAKNAISIGVGNVVSGENSGALGDPSIVNGAASYTFGNDNAVGSTSSNVFVLGNNNQMGARATYGTGGKLVSASGLVNTTAVNGAASVGNRNYINSSGTYVLGSGINTTGTAASLVVLGDTVANSVYLGNDSTVTANAGANALKDSTTAGTTTTGGATGTVSSATVGAITYSGFAGQTADGAVSVGASGAERRIQNVAAGEIAATSTDAINGSQLHATQTAIGNLASSTATHLGGGAAVQANGSISAPTYTVNGNTYNNVGAALTAATTHYYSVKSTNQAAGSNYNNDGATADGALAAGVAASATAYRAVAVGSEANASQIEAVAIGTKANASNTGTVAIGQEAKAEGISAAAIGLQAEAKGNQSYAMGATAKATQAQTVAIGYQTKAEGQFGTAVGNGATVGTGATHATAVGSGATASAASSLALGSGKAIGVSSVAIGRASEAYTGNDIAIGSDAKAGVNGATDSSHSIAIGRGAQALQQQAVAIGNSANVTVANGVALGASAVANRAALTPSAATSSSASAAVNTVYASDAATAADKAAISATVKGALGAVSVGSGTATRQIINVAAGSEDTDAVNVAQLKAVAKAASAGQTHFYSVNSTDNTAGNYDNRGATGADALAAGVGASAAVQDSVAIGKNATTTGAAGQSGAIAIGRTANADGQGSTAIGINARSAGQSIAIGTNANNSGGTPDTIGASTITIGNNANAAATRAVALGNDTMASGLAAIAHGSAAVAEGQSSVVIGDSAKNIRATGVAAYPEADQVVAIGTSSNVNSLGGIAIGSTAKTTGVYGTALGIGSVNNTNFGVALGALSTTDSNIVVNRDGYDPLNPTAAADADILATRANASGVSVGGKVLSAQGSAPGQTAVRPNGVSDGDIIRRQIHNVAAGTENTDAVNVAQLKAVAAKTATTPLVVADGTSGVPAGKVVAPAAADAGKLATAGDIANAINNAGFTLTAQGANGSLVNAGETVDLRNTDNNIVISKAATDNTVNFKLADSVKIGPATGGSPITINGTAGTISGLASNLPATTSTGTPPTASQTAPTNPTTGNAATVGDVLNAGWNLQRNDTAVDFVRPYDTINFADGIGTTVTTSTDFAKTTIKVNINAQGLAESAQLPVVYTKADGTRVYKRADGNFYDAPTGGNVVGAADVVASMQDATGSTTAPTKLTNVAAGTISATSTDAINGSQLHATNTQVAGNTAALGGGASFNPATGAYTPPSYTITKTDGSTYAANNVGDALSNLNQEVIKPITFAGDSGTASARKLGETLTIKGGETNAANLSNGNNIGVVSDGAGTLTVKLAKDVNLGADGSITTGNTKVDNAGITIAAPTPTDPNNTVSLTASGLNNGGNVITNVASGGNTLTNAANIGDVQKAAAAAANTVSAGSSNVKVTTTTNTNNSTNYAVSVAPAALQYTNTNNAAGNNTPSADQFTPTDQVTLVGAAGSTGGVTINNVAPGEISSTSKQAINGGQLHNTATDIAGIIGGNAAVDNAGNVTASNIGGTGANNINDAIKTVKTTVKSTDNSIRVTASPANATDGTVFDISVNAQGIAQSAQLPVVYTDASGNKVYKHTDGKFYTDVTNPATEVAAANVIASMQNAAGSTTTPTTLTNVAAGVNATDAVNVSQLNAVAGNVVNVTNQINAVDARVTAVDARVTNVDNRVTNVDNRVTQLGNQVTNIGGQVNDLSALVGTNPTNPDGTRGTTTYDVEQQTTTTHTNLLDTVNKMNLEGIKYVHTNDNGEVPVLSGAQTNDSSAGADGSSAVGVNAVVERQATNGLALGRRTRVSATNATAVGNESVAGGASAIAIGDGAQALGEKSISIGTGNIVHAARSGAIGDPTTIVASATDSYSIGNNNTVNTADTFVMGNNVVTTVANSVYLGGGAAATAAPTAQSAGMANYSAATINGVTYHYAGGTPAGVVSVGDVGQERRIQNVAAGLVSPTSTDAINGSQLYQTTASINALGNRVNINHDKAMGGVASAMATAGLPQAYLPGKSMIAMGGATYQGRTAVAVGVSTISDNGHWIIKGSLNSNSHGHVGATIGAGYQW